MVTIDDQFEFLQDFCMLVRFAVRLGFKVTAGELFRPQEMQQIYFDTGRSKTLNSQHKSKLAGDLNFFIDGKYVNGASSLYAIEALTPLGKFWESLSPQNRWGGNFDKNWDIPDPWKDMGHFERQLK